MTGISAGCVAIARPYAQRICGRARHDARVSGTADLPFRTIAVIPGPPRHDGKSTANAVGWQHPPGFKSPILRSDQQFRLGAPSPGDCCFPPSGAVAWPPPQSGRPFTSSATSAAAGLSHARNLGRLAPFTNRPAVMFAHHGGPGRGTRPADAEGHEQIIGRFARPLEGCSHCVMIAGHGRRARTRRSGAAG